MAEFTSDLTCVVLVDGLHGVNAPMRLFNQYSHRLIGCMDLGDYEAIDSVDQIDELIDYENLYIKTDDGAQWRIEYREGDIIAVNPNAEYCNFCNAWELNSLSDDNSWPINAHYLPYIINGDCSGLEDNEIKLIDDFLSRESSELVKYHWAHDSNENHREFTVCAISGLRGDCEYLILVSMDNST